MAPWIWSGALALDGVAAVSVAAATGTRVFLAAAALRPAGRDRGVERVPIPALRQRPDAVVVMDDPAAREAGKVQAALRAAGIVSRHLPSCSPDPT